MRAGQLPTSRPMARLWCLRFCRPRPTVTMTLQFLRAGNGALTASGRVRESGRSLVFCDAEGQDAQRRTVATATGTFKVRRGSGDA